MYRNLITQCAALGLFFGVCHAQPDVRSNTAAADTLRGKSATYLQIRGLVHEPRKRTKPLRAAMRYALFLPRNFLNGALYAVGYGPSFIGRERFVEKFDFFFYDGGRKFGWKPLVKVSADYPLEVGIKVKYRSGRLASSLNASWPRRFQHRLMATTSYVLKEGIRPVRLTLSAGRQEQRRRRFYGIGAHPETDSRNAWTAVAPGQRAEYAQRRIHVSATAGMILSGHWEAYLASAWWTRRLFESPAGEPNELADLFVLDRLPGAGTPAEQVYSEFRLVYDSREFHARTPQGFRSAAHIGYARGTRNDRSQYLRYGLDLAGFVPVLKKNRVFLPRLIINGVTNNADLPLHFTDYPRHQTFRAVNDRTILRTDNFVVVPSLEYQWPLTFHLGGHIFVDGLIVSREISKFRPAAGEWAWGIGVDMHTQDGEFGRGEIAFGPEGVKILATVGVSARSNDRLLWK